MDEKQLRLGVTLRIYSADEKCFGPGVAELLERVDKMQSLRQATMSMQMAYSKAWTILKKAEQQLGCKLLFSSAGGKNGGGAELTPQGLALLEAYDAYCAALEDASRQLFSRYFADFQQEN